MPQDDISNLPPNVQASIKAARKEAEKAETKKAQTGSADWTSEEEDLAAMSTPKKKEKTYVVQPGDSLSKIAKELLGDATRWPEIFELNKDQIKDPNLIHVGQELRLP